MSDYPSNPPSGTLFDLTAGEPRPDRFNGTKHPETTCTPGRIGDGPAGETCGTCRHHIHVLGGSKPWQKCFLARAYWRGQATDIKASWSACPHWEAIEPKDATT